jgi:hypothetical protein
LPTLSSSGGSEEPLSRLRRLLQAKKRWWGERRLDYVLYSPEQIANLPRQSLPYIFHSCFWESADASAFVLRTLAGHDNYRENYRDNHLDSGDTHKESAQCSDVNTCLAIWHVFFSPRPLFPFFFGIKTALRI